MLFVVMLFIHLDFQVGSSFLHEKIKSPSWLGNSCGIPTISSISRLSLQCIGECIRRYVNLHWNLGNISKVFMPLISIGKLRFCSGGVEANFVVDHNAMIEISLDSICRAMIRISLDDIRKAMIGFFCGSIRIAIIHIFWNGLLRQVLIQFILKGMMIPEITPFIVTMFISKIIDLMRTEHIPINGCGSIFWAGTEAVTLTDELGDVSAIST